MQTVETGYYSAKNSVFTVFQLAWNEKREIWRKKGDNETILLPISPIFSS